MQVDYFYRNIKMHGRNFDHFFFHFKTFQIIITELKRKWEFKVVFPICDHFPYV